MASAMFILSLKFNSFLKIFAPTYSTGNLRELVICKISNYIPGFLGQVAETLLVCACIDRYLIISKNIHLRAFSTIKRTKYITYSVYIL